MTQGNDRLDQGDIQQVLIEIRELRQEVEQFQTQVGKISEDLASESKKWDERFFQLSRDTLNFSRNVIVTAAVVAVLAPILRDSLSAIFEILVTPR